MLRNHGAPEPFSKLRRLLVPLMFENLEPQCEPWCWYIYHYLPTFIWVIYGVNVGVHIPAPWFAYGEMKECQTPQAFLIGGSSPESVYGMGYNVGFPPKSNELVKQVPSHYS